MQKLSIIFTMLFVSTFAFSQKLTQKVFEGTLNKKIPVIVTLTFENNLITGSVVYKKQGIPIDLMGRIDLDGTLYFTEFLKDGHITGSYNVTLNDELMSGSWFDVGKINAKELSVSLKKIAETTVPKMAIPDVTGAYRFFYGNDGGRNPLSSALDVQQIGKDKIAIRLNCVSAGPSYNIATIDKTIIQLTGNQAVYNIGNCKFSITFLANGANVEYLADGYECGFGNNVGVSGNYLKINALKPTFLKRE